MAAALVVLACIPLALRAQSAYRPQEVIVKFRPGVAASEATSIRSNLSATVEARWPLTGAELWRVRSLTVEQAIARYRDDLRLAYIEPNYLVYAVETIPSDAQFSRLWGLHNTGQTGGTRDADIDAPEAWDLATESDMVVGVIDTGVDWRHPDLAANIWVNEDEVPNNQRDDDGNGFVDDVRGWDFYNKDSDPMDDHGHGTHVSGTIAAVGDNRVGVAGVCWSAKIMPLKFLSGGGSGSTADAISAIGYAVRMGANITSNSWGSPAFSQALRDAIALSEQAGLLFVAAAGNDGWNTDEPSRAHYPSGLDLASIISVAATDAKDLKAGFSNYGRVTVDLGAPGADIYSTLRGGTYGSLSGTSMATPHVAGAAALVWSYFPELTALELKHHLLSTVDPNASLRDRCVSGGRLNLFKALAEPDGAPPEPVDDLAVTATGSNRVTLAWTASGDDGNVGVASAYDLRYSRTAISESNFAAATQAAGEPTPQPAGVRETFAIDGLQAGTTYFFALRVLDEAGGASFVSNSPSATTLGAPELSVAPESFAVQLGIGQSATRALTIRNLAQGILDVQLSVAGTLDRNADGTVDAFVLDGWGTWSNSTLWDYLNQNWARHGDRRVRIDDQRFHAVGITYDALRSSGAEVLIVSDNWSSTQNYGAFSAVEAQAIARYVNEGAGLLVTGGTFNNGDFPALQTHVDYLAPLVGVRGDVSYRWSEPAYEDVVFSNTTHPVWRGVSSPYASNYRNKSLLPSTGSWQGAVLDGQVLGLSAAGKTAVVALRNRVLYSSMAELDNGNDEDKQFLYNAIVFAGRPWLTVSPAAGTVPGGGQLQVVASFDARTLRAGVYAAEIRIASNDADERLVVVPTVLTVTAAPTTPPTVAIVAPANGASVSGKVTIRVTAEDADGIERVRFVVSGSSGGVFDQTDSTAPFEVLWDATSRPVGSYGIAATAFDTTGQQATANITVQVAATPTSCTWSAGAESGHPPLSGTWTISQARAHAGGSSYFSRYTNNQCAALVTPALRLSAGKASKLSFWLAYSIEAGWDGGVVEISTNAGQTWSLLTPSGGYPGTFASSTNGCRYAVRSPSYTGTNLTWRQQSVDLARYNGQEVRLRFNFSTDRSVVREGWYVDDLSVTEVNRPEGCR